MCHALGARLSSVMAARVRLKIHRGTGVPPLAVLLAVCAVLSLVSGMFEHRHCDHKHPRAHEVSAFISIAKGDSNLSFAPYGDDRCRFSFRRAFKYTLMCSVIQYLV